MMVLSYIVAGFAIAFVVIFGLGSVYLARENSKRRHSETIKRLPL
jgi:hypothetical protein